MNEDPEKLAQEVAKYAFAFAFALGFRQDEALVHHNRENLKYWVDQMLSLDFSRESDTNKDSTFSSKF